MGAGGPRRRGAAAGRAAPRRLGGPGIGLGGLPAGCRRSPKAHGAGGGGGTADPRRGLPAAPGAASAEAAEDSWAPRGPGRLLQPGGHPDHPAPGTPRLPACPGRASPSRASPPPGPGDVTAALTRANGGTGRRRRGAGVPRGGPGPCSPRPCPWPSSRGTSIFPISGRPAVLRLLIRTRPHGKRF